MATKKKAPKAISSREASRALMPKSFQWEGFDFQWFQHKRAFRVMSKMSGFVGYVRGSAEDAKSAAVAFQMTQLVDAAQKACEEIDRMRDCLNEHQSSLQVEIAATRRLMASSQVGVRFMVDDVEPDE